MNKLISRVYACKANDAAWSHVLYLIKPKATEICDSRSFEFRQTEFFPRLSVLDAKLVRILIKSLDD